MFEIVIGFISFLTIVAMATMGAVSLAKLWCGKWARGTSVLLATARGSLLPFGPLGLLSSTLSKTGSDTSLRVDMP